jgi:hypothetical protein
MAMNGLETAGKISIKRLKHRFAKEFPNSPLLSILVSMPDEISGEELIGAVAVLLDLLDRETHNNIGGEI